MSKITVIGNGFVQINGSNVNLKQYKSIDKYDFGYDEDPDGEVFYGIKATPLTPSAKDIEDGVDGSLIICSYGENEKNMRDEDFDKISTALKE